MQLSKEEGRNDCDVTVDADALKSLVTICTRFLARINAKRGENTPRFQCYSTNDGDSWYDHPADAELLNDVGAEKVGDEFEVSAGWRCVTARYCVIKTPDEVSDDFEVECMSHPGENAPLFLHPQPCPKCAENAAFRLIAVEHANVTANEALRYQKTIWDLQTKVEHQDAEIAQLKGDVAVYKKG